MSFSANYTDILAKVNAVNPVEYATTRNFKNGAVSYLSPYISRGIISCKQVYDSLVARGFSDFQIAKFHQELAWREYWQRVWQNLGDDIYADIKNQQIPVNNHGTPTALIKYTTGITAIDDALKEFYKTGYLHNHMRMYIASLATNFAHSHWKNAADWMYYHLLDGDVASNYLSWQWVCGANANKKYVANQDNINHFFGSDQIGTFLDAEYDHLPTTKTPSILIENTVFKEVTKLPKSNNTLPKAAAYKIYNYYNLDPQWLSDKEAIVPVLLLEPAVFDKHPVSEQCIQFMLDFNTSTLNAHIFVGSFSDLKNAVINAELHYKEHPLNNYKGVQHDRDWMFPEVNKYLPSFFGFWKKCKKVKKNEAQ